MSRRHRTNFWLGLLLAMCGTSVGCTPATLGALLYPFSEDKVQPECKLAPEKKNKEVTVAIVCNFSRPETRPDLIPADQELAERLARVLSKNFRDNKEKVTIISPARVRAAQSKLDSRGVATDQEIGAKLKADYVINLDINVLELTDRKTRDFYRGRTEIGVRATDMGRIKGEGQVLEKDYHRSYPGNNNEREISECSAHQFRGEFLDKVALELAHWFCAYPKNDRFDMD